MYGMWSMTSRISVNNKKKETCIFRSRLFSPRIVLFTQERDQLRREAKWRETTWDLLERRLSAPILKHNNRIELCAGDGIPFQLDPDARRKRNKLTLYPQKAYHFAQFHSFALSAQLQRLMNSQFMMIDLPWMLLYCFLLAFSSSVLT